MSKQIAKHLQSIIADANAALELIGTDVAESTTSKKPAAGKNTGKAVEETVEQELDLETLEGMDIKDLKKVAKDAKIAGYAKMDEDTLRAAIAEFYEIDLEDEEDGEEEEDLTELDDAELVEKAEELEVEPVYTGKGKKKALDRDATIAAIEEALESEDEEDGEDEEYTEEELEEMEDADLLEVAEECGVDPVYTGKGKKKALDREAVIAAIIEYQDEEAGEEGEDEEEEDALEIYEEEDLDALDEDELKEHLVELSEAAEDGEFEMPKNWKKISGKVKLRKAILEVYAQLEE